MRKTQVPVVVTVIDWLWFGLGIVVLVLSILDLLRQGFARGAYNLLIAGFAMLTASGALLHLCGLTWARWLLGACVSVFALYCLLFAVAGPGASGLLRWFVGGLGLLVSGLTLLVLPELTRIDAE